MSKPIPTATMASTSNQPLLGVPKTRSTYTKALYALLSIAAFLGTTAIVSFTISTINHSSPQISLNSQLNDATNLQNTLQKSLSQIQHSIEFTHNIKARINDLKSQAALADCLELMDMSMDRVMNSMIVLQNLTAQSHSDVHTWLSSVLTNHLTCFDGLTGSARVVMEHKLNDLILRAREALAMVVKIAPAKQETAWENLVSRDFPSWVTRNDRRLLQSTGQNIQANVVVAKDGSGKYTSVKAAVAAAPDKGKSRYVIYVKKGIYKENVEIGKSKTNLMLVGDGMDATIITGSLNVVDGSTTFRSATVAVVGDGFIAQDLRFQNTAGPQKHQAVALRVGADKSVINRCKIDAFQDTLYAHSLRQFYRDCYITGTVDFIFGDAAVVIQNSKLAARKPMSGQKNMLTAQGRTDPNSVTGTSIQNCDIIPSSDLSPVKGSIKTYLGRPWKEYSRTVYLQSNIDDHIDPAGWFPWDGEFALKTLYYGEYMNKGPGAGTGGRVKWPGYHVIKTAAEASKFTVAQFIQGGAWLKNTGVAYTEGL